jgi:hypothetical protein
MEALKIGVTGFDMEVYYKNSNGKWTKDKNHSISAKLGKYVTRNQDALDAFGITDDIRDNSNGCSLKDSLAAETFEEKCEDNGRKYDYTKYFKNGTKTWANCMLETNKGEYKIKIRLWGSPNGKKVYSKWTSVLLTKPVATSIKFNDKTKKATINITKGSNYETRYYIYASATVNMKPQTSEEFAAYGKTVIYPYKFAYVTSSKKTKITVPYKSDLGSISTTNLYNKSKNYIERQYMVVAESVIDGEKVYSFSWTSAYPK